MGVSFLPEYAIECYLQSGELTKLSLDVPPQSYYSQILYHKDKWAAPYVDGFVEIVRRLCPENQAQAGARLKKLSVLSACKMRQSVLPYKNQREMQNSKTL